MRASLEEGKLKSPRGRYGKLCGKPLLQHSLVCSGLSDNAESDELSEFVVAVEWIRTVDRSAAKWKSKSGLYTTPLIRASLDGQPGTVAFLEKQFELKLRDLVR
jgi:hypothetical protein